ncbi:MAG: hypothetical protein SNG34_02400 [Rikenellaceae bacterium]
MKQLSLIASALLFVACATPESDTPSSSDGSLPQITQIGQSSEYSTARTILMHAPRLGALVRYAPPSSCPFRRLLQPRGCRRGA